MIYNPYRNILINSPFYRGEYWVSEKLYNLLKVRQKIGEGEWNYAHVNGTEK